MVVEDSTANRSIAPRWRSGFSFENAAASPTARLGARAARAAIGAPIANFEGLSNQDNFNLLGGRVNPPDPIGDVGPNHYVEMINLVFAVYNKQGPSSSAR